MSDAPEYIELTFLACVLSTFCFLVFSIMQASGKSRKRGYVISTLLLVWIVAISLIAMNGWFLNFESFPPRLFLFVLPALLLIVGSFVWKTSRDFLMKLPISSLTYLHIVRIPVEIVLWWLFLKSLVPESITFQGVNLDIISGITAPFVGVFFIGPTRKKYLLAFLWNLATLGLLFNVVIRAIAATPYFLDSQTATLPNMAVFYFPFVLLPAFVVPAVLFAHLVSIMQLFNHRDHQEQ